MKKIIIFLFCYFLFLLIILPTIIFAQEMPIIDESQVAKVHLQVYEKLGTYEGYLIFYDRNGTQCAVKLTATSYIENGERIFDMSRLNVIYKGEIIMTKELDISPDKFTFCRLINGQTILAYPISIIPSSNFPSYKPYAPPNFNTITFEFKSTKFYTKTECSLR